MKTHRLLTCGMIFPLMGLPGRPGTSRSAADADRPLPPPLLAGRLSLEEAIASRRSVRDFAVRPLTLEQISQLCWAGQGITDDDAGFRAAPSAGALYPIELFVLTAGGLDHYVPAGHRLRRSSSTDLRARLAKASLDQESIGQAAACFVIAAVEERTARKYGKRAERYCALEAGHVAQNILLEAASLQLAGVPVGAFDDNEVAAVLSLPKDHHVLYIVAVGHPRG